MDWSTRLASHEDLDILVSFTRAEAQSAEGRNLGDHVVRGAIELALGAPESKAQYIVVEGPEGVVGHCSVFKEWSDWLAAPYLWIQSMYVDPPHRGKGAMGALLQAVDDHARSSGAPEVRIYVHRDNTRGERAWEREGFEPAPYKMRRRRVRSISR
jgi:GNAT superfamily N-acetyltransferase